MDIDIEVTGEDEDVRWKTDSQLAYLMEQFIKESEVEAY
jgi:hypothetical protein